MTPDNDTERCDWDYIRCQWTHSMVMDGTGEERFGMSLDQEIEAKRAEVRTDGYPMSIGELINLYRDGDLDIHPEFQRFYRWSPEQKSRLIESILLGIPIPINFRLAT